MQSRVVRITLVALLLAAGIAAAFLVWQTELTLQALERDRRTREAALERLVPAVDDIAAAQQAYIDNGDRDDAVFARVATLLEQITTAAVSLQAGDRSPAGAAHLDQFWSALSALTTANTQARQLLTAGESLMAADTLFSSARPHVATLGERLRAFRDAESTHVEASRTALTQQSWLVVGAVAISWALGLIALARIPAPATAVPAFPSAAERTSFAPSAMAAPTAREDDLELRPAPRAAPPDVQEHRAAPAPLPIDEEGPLKVDISLSPSVDLAAAADLCAAISRMTQTDALPDILARAASLIDARGLIIWLGAGDELLAATAWGYDASVVARLRPINRRDQNATAAAWRDGELRIVTGDGASHGAIVAPMFNVAGCVGVLAAEVRNGRENNDAVRAVTAIIASQLAGVLSAWPAPGAAAQGAEALTSAASGRQAAAS